MHACMHNFCGQKRFHNGSVDPDEWWGQIDDYMLEATLFGKATPRSMEAHKIGMSPMQS